jgi:hypothetical protein
VLYRTLIAVRGDDVFSAGKGEAKRNSQEATAKREER